ncbi:MAG: plasmid recombination protein, partial [Eubacterium sp.]
RRIPDYYEHLKKSSKGKPYYEIVVQFGDMESCGQGSGKWEEAKLMLDDYMRGFEKRNPNLKVFNAVMHLDEATPHLHIDFIPIAHKVERGLSVKVSMKGALKEQGFTSANRLQNEWSAWEEQERSVMTEILHAHELSRDVKGVRREHLTVDDYKKHAANLAEIKKVNAHINELKKKNFSDLTEDEIELIKNQNDLMRSEIQKRDKEIFTLSRKLGAEFVPFEIYSEDKLLFVAGELAKSGVPYVEEGTTLHIPDYARKTAAAIAATYRPIKSEGIREKIKLDIDRLVYSAESFEGLISTLKERGYEIKRGKYVAVKAPFAERFVRLKTLGEAYLPKNLEQRIADRDVFTNAVRTKFKTANAVEKKFHVTIMDMTIEIKQFRLMPRKDNSKFVYAFQNDSNINYLSEQLLTIGEFGFGSREQIYSKADELKRSIDEKNEKVKSLTAEIPTLKSDISQLRFLFSAVSTSKPDAMTQVKLAAAREIADKYGVKSEGDIASLEKRLKLLPDYISSIKDEVSEEQLKLGRVSNLISAYERIVEGNYIDNLIRAQREQEVEKNTVCKKS